ncbi:hypothetical protein BH23ACT12_BH23ACT12_15340 [soil metagenome]
MGSDKSRSTVGGVPMGARAGLALLRSASPVLAVGPDPGLGLATVEDSRRGPLAALAAGMRHLADTGCTGPVLLAACDLPFLTPELLDLVAGELSAGALAAVPVAGDRLQPLAACYAPGVLAIAEGLVDKGELSMKALLDTIEVRRVGPEAWGLLAGPYALTDVDTPADLAAANRTLR